MTKGDSDTKKYDLSERTFKFSKDLLKTCRKVKEDTVTRPILNQLVRSGTSVGANYSEADSANSKRDFVNKISIAKKEANETKYWLRLLSDEIPALKDELDGLFREAQELHLIFSSIIRKSTLKT